MVGDVQLRETFETTIVLTEVFGAASPQTIVDEVEGCGDCEQSKMEVDVC
jgi:hypothetical protein